MATTFTESGLYVYNATYTANGTSLTIGTQYTANGHTTISITTATSLLSNASVKNVDDTTYNVENTYIGTVSLPGGVQGFLVLDTTDSTNTTKHYYIFTTSALPAGSTGKTAAVDISGDSSPTNHANWNTTTGVPAPCFLAGTRILTPTGEVAVESLQEGDLVTTVLAGETITAPVTWVGHRSVKPGDLPVDDAHPVRIKAGAFATAVPHRDLLVTAEHCIFVDGGLIPARLLVNGRSIIIDRSIASFTYYHIELADHAILLAEGLATESYLATGNRDRFANTEVAALRPNLALTPEHKSWADAVAPLTVEAASVEPVWRTLNERAQRLGIGQTLLAPMLSADPDFHIVTTGGAALRPLRRDGNKVLFMLPPNAGELSLVSRTARPSDTVAPFIDDRRALGVLVGEINIYAGRRKTSITAHLQNPDLTGWFAQDMTGQRWTAGRAMLPACLATQNGQAAILEVEILQAGPYEMPEIAAVTAAA